MGTQDQHYPHRHVFLLRCVIVLTSIRVPSNKDIILSGTAIPTNQEFMHYFIKSAMDSFTPGQRNPMTL